MELLVLLASFAAGVGMLSAIGWRERPRLPLQTVELRFGIDVTAVVVEAMLGSIAGLPRRAVVVVDALSEAEGIRHLLHADQQILDTLQGSWRGLLPSLRVQPAEAVSPIGWTGGVALRLAGRYPVLRSDAATESVASLLGSLQPLGRDERVLARWMLAPGSPPRVPLARRTPKRGGGLMEFFAQASELPPEHVRVVRHKYDGPVLAGVGLVAARAGHPKRAAHLMSRVVSVMRTRRGGYGQLVVRRRGARQLERLLDRPARGRDLYSPAEAAGLLGWPIGAPQVPGLALGSAPLLMPSQRIPSMGRVLAAATWPGSDRPLAQPVVGAMSHTLIVGPTGVGKSALVANLVAQDLEAGRGALVLDGKGGELVDAVLARVPAGRTDDVIVLDPGREGPVPGLRLFGRGSSPELVADLVLGIFASLFAESWGPLSAKWLRAGLIALAHDPQHSTLADLPFVFSDHGYRHRLVRRIDDPLLQNTFAAFEAMSPQQRSHELSAATNKLDEIVGRRVVRSVLAQSEPSLDMHEVLRTGKVVLVALAPERIGPAARLIAALVIFKFFEAVQGREAIPEARRRPFFAYVDEPKVLGDLPVPLDSLYERARSAGVGMVLSAQSLVQLPTDLSAAVRTNAASWIVFRQSSADARLLAPELRGVTPEALQDLAAFEVVARIGLGPGDVAPPATGRTLAPSPQISDPELVRQASAARYGGDPAAVDAALRTRHEKPEPDLPVGQTRRQS